MTVVVEKKAGIKESAKNMGSKIKSYVNKKHQSLKGYAKKFKDDIRKAYDIGYSRGWDDAYEIPKRIGAKTAAAYGYKKGVKQRHKSDKYTNQYNRKWKNN